MHLAIDIGNTKTKIAFFKGDKIISVHSILNSESFQPTREELAQTTQAIVSSVSLPTQAWHELFPNVQWVDFSHQTQVPFKNAYDTPQTLGLDRIALAAAAQKKYPFQNTLIIDAGTCVTYDFIDKNGTYQGGAIAPGLHMRLKAMHHFTEKLPLIKEISTVNFIEKSTMACMQSGALNGLAAEIDGFILQISQQYQPLNIVLTGGDAELLAPLIKNSIFAHPNFLLEGLHAILVHNIN